MYQYPANINEASLHKLANKFGYNSKKLKDGKNAPLCPCCELPPTKNIIWQSILFIYLGFRFLITDGYNLITNIFAQNCNDPKNISECSNNFAAKFSDFNKNTNSDEIYLFTVDVLNIITVFLSIIFFALYRRYQYRIYNLIDKLNHTQADFTIFVERMPILLPKSLGNNSVSLEKCDY